MPAAITLFKFIGTVSLGLLTGVSYTLSTQSLPSLLTLPSAKPAAHTLSQSLQLAKLHIRALSTLSAVSFFSAFVLSPARIRHPYLLWTALVAGLSGAVMETKALQFKGKAKAKEEEEDWEKVGEMNGEQVEKRARDRQFVEFVRTGVAGTAFAMGVVGIWGDGA